MGTTITPTEGGKEFEMLEAGTYPARLYSIVHQGTTVGRFGPQTQAILKFEIPSEKTVNIIEETIRESRILGDNKERLLEKVKKTVSQLEANLCLNCNMEISKDCDLCNGNAYTEKNTPLA